MSVKEVYEPSTAKRRRRTKAQVRQLEKQIRSVLANDHPQSVRHVFYRMTDPRLPEPVEKSEKGYRAVQRRVVEMRRSGIIPYGWITDATRQGYHVNTFDGAGDFLASVNGLYRADLWRDADYRCEVWTESRSIAGVVRKDCQELAASLYPAGGFTSITLAFQAAEYINEGNDGREVVIFYIGDYDPAGVLIDVSLEKELRTHLHSDVPLRFERIAITPEQIEAHSLPTKPRKATDRRSLEVQHTVEAEAMPAGLLRYTLRSHIEALLPTGALEITKVAEESERAQIMRVAEMLGGAA